MELSPIERVLFLQETLDTIFQFLDPQNLIKCRTVCRYWRIVSNIHLSRDLITEDFEQVDAKFGMMEIPSGCSKLRFVRFIGTKEHSAEIIITKPSSSRKLGRERKPKLKLVSSSNTSQKQNQADTRCLVIQDSRAIQTINVGGWRRVKPMPRFVSTVLQANWLPSVGKLVLDRCLTADDWNAAANGILAKFPALVELQLWLPQDRNSVLPLVYADLMKEEKVELPSLKEVLIQYYYSFTWSHRQPCKELGLGGFHLESVEWTSGVDWDFLTQCTNLRNFLAFVYFGLPNVMGRCDCVNIKASRYAIENSEQTFGSLGLSVWNDNFTRKVKINSTKNGYNSVVAKEIATIVTTLEPTQLRIPLKVQLHSAIASSNTPARTEQLEFSELVHEMPWNWRLEASPHDVASAFTLAASFDNIKRLNFPYLCSPLDFEDITPLPPTCFAKNLVTLMLKSSNDWMQEHLSKLMPNVQLLVFSYPTNAAGYSELPKILKLCSSFKRLKHLVLVLERSPSQVDVDTGAVCAELEKQNTEYLNGLKSLTVISNVELDLKQLTEQCVSICSYVESIRKLGVFSDTDSDDQDRVKKRKVDPQGIYASKLRFPIPYRLAVRAGSTASLGFGKVMFDGMLESHVTWKELLRMELVE